MSDFDLIAATNLHMTRGRFPTTRRTHYYPSSASAVTPNGVVGGCLRQSWYRVQDNLEFTPAPSSPSGEWAAELGIAVESLLIENWKQMGIWVANNIKWYDKDRNISGELDAIIRTPEGKEKIIELKTFWGYYASSEICGNTRKEGKPKVEHQMQLMLYLDHFKHRIEEGKLLYFARDSAARKEFDMHLTQHTDGKTYAVIDGKMFLNVALEDIYARYADLDNYYKNKVEPPRDYMLEYTDQMIEAKWAANDLSKAKYEAFQKKGIRPGDFQCNYCRFANLCWNKD